MKCPHCHRTIPDTAAFCGHCGQRLTAPAPAPPAIPAVAPIPGRPRRSGWGWGLIVFGLIFTAAAAGSFYYFTYLRPATPPSSAAAPVPSPTDAVPTATQAPPATQVLASPTSPTAPSTLAASPTRVPDNQATNEAQQAAESSTEQARATAAAGPMATRMAEWRQAGLVSAADGTFHALDDFEKSYADAGSFSWSPTGVSVGNFVLAANLAWESATTQAAESGCGFVFREQDGQGFYWVKYQLSGFVSVLKRLDAGGGGSLAFEYVKFVDSLSGEVEMVLIAEGDTLTILIDGERVVQVRDSSLRSGRLSYAVFSGTNEGFGIRCRVTGVALWDLD